MTICKIYVLIIATLLFQVVSQLKSGIKFSWKPPHKNPQNVINYEVKITDIEKEEEKLEMVDGNEVQWTFRDPPESRTFAVRVRANGKRGKSTTRSNPFFKPV